MTRTLIILLALSVGLNVGLLVRGNGSDELPPPGDRRPGGPPVQFEQVMEHHLEQMTEGLSLRDDQIDEIRKTHDALFPAIRASHREVERLRNEAAKAFGVEADPDRFRVRVAELSRAQVELDSLLTEVLLGESAVLGPEQRRRYVGHSPWSRRIEEPGAGSPPPPRR